MRTGPTPRRAARPRGSAPGRRPAPGRARWRPSRRRTDTTAFQFRNKLGLWAVFAILGLAAAQLLSIQLFQAPQLSAEAASQRTTRLVEPATRGTISDRNGNPLAYTMEAKAITFQPVRVRNELSEARAKDPSQPEVSEYLEGVADAVHEALGAAAPEKDVLEKLESDETFVYLARGVDPGVAAGIVDEYSMVGLERQDIRLYPGGSLAANLVGATGWDGYGLIGLEASMDSVLAGTDGSSTYDRGSDGVVIPGSWRDQHPAVDGSSLELTIDNDIQYHVQQQVQRAKELSGADNASAVVLDAATGQVLAMSNDSTFDPSIGVANNPPTAQQGNPAVSSPFEPGSVNKIITAAGAIEDGLTTPDEVLQVPGSINMAGVTVKDAWDHGVVPYTTTGIFGKSSNVGTLMLAERMGEDRFAELLDLFGLGQRTEVGLPGESAGLVPSREQWSGGTFANLPIGQGLSMTLLQMTGIFQAIANDGERIPPRIVNATVGPDGTRTETEPPEPIRVVSPQTAATVRDMFRSVVQSDTGNQQGTGAQAAIEGYQIAGKTGTAQQIDPNCGCYSNSDYWITFAGIAPSDDPKYVIGIMLDAPTRSSDGTGGQSAAPLFRDIASWLLQRAAVPLSPDSGGKLILQVD
ncbi:peptidoglycan D,D-transpeptidase FtsI family protein [Rhodococcus sp. NPDC060090]|uniref:peptidoglycan D,D-transpeptidase FtsI family protein n=1 Tax=Rhodococcus sp. NPDC060090 TaxID=3347056 RepID=UPI00364C60CA